MTIYKRNDIYWYDFRVAKKRWRGSTGEINKRKAQVFHDDLQARKKREALGLEVTITTNGGTRTIFQTIDEYLNWSKTQNRNSTYGLKLALWNGGKFKKVHSLKDAIGDGPLHTINATHIDKIRSVGKKRGLNDTSINRHTYNFKNFVSWACDQKYLHVNPVHHVRSLKVEEREPVTIADKDFTRIMNHVPVWLREIFWVDWMIGVRLSNLIKLRYHQINLEDQYIEFPPSEMKKGRTARITIKHLPELIEFFRIRKLAHPLGDYVWPSSKPAKNNLGVRIEKHYDPSYVSRCFSAAAEDLGIKVKPYECTFHSIRHTFATRWAEDGMDLVDLGKMLSHRNIASTQRYVHVEDQITQDNAVKKIVRRRKDPGLYLGADTKSPHHEGACDPCIS